ncbi:MAG: hypothetical protein U1E15_11330 [Hyphomicrobiales bacterium]
MKPDFSFGEEFAPSPDVLLFIICAMQASSVLFGAGLVVVLAMPALNDVAIHLIPALAYTALIVSPPMAVQIARRMRLRNWGREAWARGDMISG